MPSLEGAPAPSANPHLYPGIPVPGDCLLAGDWLYRLRPEPGDTWTVTHDGGPIDTDADHVPLDDVLAGLAVTPMIRRRPIVAIGSNASPGQLLHKWAGHLDAIPMTRAVATDIGVGYSAHIARAGYLPYAPHHADGNRLPVFVLWLDDDQIALLDTTERNYHHTTISGGDYPLRLANGRTPPRWGLYRSQWGVLADPDVIIAGDQYTAFGHLISRGLGAHLPDWPDLRAVQAALAADDSRRTALREALAEFAYADELRTPVGDEATA